MMRLPLVALIVSLVVSVLLGGCTTTGGTVTCTYSPVGYQCDGGVGGVPRR